MNLGIFLSSGDSFAIMSKSGQDIRFKTFYLKAFAKNFKKVYIFSYANEKVNGLPFNVYIVSNKYNLNRYIYGFLMPFINYRQILDCDVFRAYHLLGTLPAIITKIFFSKPFIFNYGYDYVEFAKIEKKNFQVILLQLITPIACIFAAKIMAVTKMVLAWTPKEKTLFIPNGVDLNVFKPIRKHSRRKLIKLLNIGRLETQKNQLNLIKATSNLKVELTIIGNGSLEKLIVQAAKKNNVKLKLIPRVENTKLPALFNDSDIFILPSLTEGPVKVLLEAMACGLPIIGANVRGINEVIIDGNNGLFCNTSVNSIRLVIQKLMVNKSLRESLAANARETMVNNFNLDNLLKKEINLIKSIYND